jgi:iron complex transport system substrate-binding protein
MKKRKEKMKTKNRFLTAIVLCALFLVTLPGIGIATAQEDETLDIYGNANEDDIIDMRDLTFTARMILRLEDETELADANYDGRVSVADMTQIGLIILGRESKLTLVDGSDRIVTVNKPVEKIVSTHISNDEAISLLGAWDRVVGRDYYSTDEILFPGVSDLPVVTGIMGCYDVDFEKVFEFDTDIFLTLYIPYNPGLEDVVATLEPEIPVVTLNFEDPATMVENLRKLRYILNTEEKGEEFIAWYEGVVNDITSKTAGLSEEDKPRVFLWMFSYDYTEKYQAIAGDWTGIQSQFEIVGGINIAEDLTGTIARDTRDWVMDADENPALAESDAVKGSRVYLYQTPMVSTPRFVVSLAYVAKWLHPELFSDLDPQAIHQEYLTDYMCIDYDLDEHGVLFYPEP